ncbi:hypothetical protein Bbelb_336900 [Branchiostoma belcheri]|nr:hypothetical protein Bbelb_336900 [Branchiostoma belcheri]
MTFGPDAVRSRFGLRAPLNTSPAASGAKVIPSFAQADSTFASWLFKRFQVQGKRFHHAFLTLCCWRGIWTRRRQVKVWPPGAMKHLPGGKRGASRSAHTAATRGGGELSHHP